MNLGGIADSLRVFDGEKLIKYISPRSELYRKEGSGLTKVGNTQRSKHAAHPTNNVAHPSATSARTAVLCCGCGITTIPN